MTRRLRVAHILVQPVLVWDDGENLAPGPPLQPQTLPLADMPAFLDGIPAELERLALEAAVAEPHEHPAPTAR